MVTTIRLTHLTYLGAGRQPASIDFGPKMTVVSGPSNTGKSFIVDSLDFMLGAKTLKEIPERSGYSDVLLGLVLPSGEAVTLARKVTGGSFFLYVDDVRNGPLPTPDSTLSAVHSAKTTENLSSYLLRSVGLDGKLLRKNVKNETISLSFRNLAHLSVVDETQMQSEVPPALSGNPVTRTIEISLLRLLLEQQDDSSLIPVASKTDARKMSNAKVEVIDQMIADLELQLSDAGDAQQLRDQLARVNRSLDGIATDRSDVSSSRDAAVEDISRYRQQRTIALGQITSLSALEGRFGLLRDQYDSDLERLAMLREAGSFLGFFEQGDCPFCGTAHKDQPHVWGVDTDLSEFGASLEAEAAKTEALRVDLLTTIDDVVQSRERLRTDVADLRTLIVDSEKTVRGFEQQLRPSQERLDQLLRARSQVEGTLSLFKQIDDLRRWRMEVEESAATEVATAAAQMDLGRIRDFSTELKTRLSAWGYGYWENTRYDREVQDIESGDQFRTSQGKGVRAILHAAFTTALMNYCLRRDLPHPGFVVLDSPLVTYREPEGQDPSDLSFADAFYADMADGVLGQVIILENVEPTSGPTEGTEQVRFTMNPDAGRYGFFPRSESPEILTQ